MADKIETNEEGTPIPQPVTNPDESGLPPVAEPSSHGKHDWQGMLQNGRKLQVCAWCGKERDVE